MPAKSTKPKSAGSSKGADKARSSESKPSAPATPSAKAKTKKQKPATSPQAVDMAKSTSKQKTTQKPGAASRPISTSRIRKHIAKSFSELRSKFKRLWPHYVFQSILCALCVLAVLWILQGRQLAIIAAIGASGFIVFAMPKSVTAQPKNILGGYLLGLAIGALSWLIPQPAFTYRIIVYAVVVGLTMFSMVATDTEHPPACGTALGVAIRNWADDQTLGVMLTIVVSAIILAVAHVVLARFLKDLV